MKFFRDVFKTKDITFSKDLDKEFLYINSLSRGVGNNDLGLDRGQLGNSRIVYFTNRLRRV